MTVSELIRLLQGYQPDMKVLTRGYESGYDDIVGLVSNRVSRDPSVSWYEGEYDLDMDGEMVVTIRNVPVKDRGKGA